MNGRNRELSKKSPGLRSGQAILEYVLLSILAAGVFGYFFGEMRKSFFQLWVCDIGAKIMSPVPCKDPISCMAKYLPSDDPGLQALQTHCQ